MPLYWLSETSPTICISGLGRYDASADVWPLCVRIPADVATLTDWNRWRI